MALHGAAVRQSSEGPANRDFNPYLNASDLLAKFVEEVGQIGVARDDVINLPVQLFIAWLVIKSAERDGDPLPEGVIPVERDPALLEITNPKCVNCGRFIPKLHVKHKFPFCDPVHAQRHLERIVA